MGMKTAQAGTGEMRRKGEEGWEEKGRRRRPGEEKRRGGGGGGRAVGLGEGVSRRGRQGRDGGGEASRYTHCMGVSRAHTHCMGESRAHTHCMGVSRGHLPLPPPSPAQAVLQPDPADVTAFLLWPPHPLLSPGHPSSPPPIPHLLLLQPVPQLPEHAVLTRQACAELACTCLLGLQSPCTLTAAGSLDLTLKFLQALL